MGRKREIIITVFIILAVLILALYEPVSNFVESKSNSTQTESTVSTKTEYIEIKITGEVAEEVTITLPKNSTYAVLIIKSKNYLNDYSYLEEDEKTQISKSMTVIFKSTDTGCYDDTIDESTSDKISISKGTYAELLTVYGIGEKRAQKIIDTRKTKTISSYEELQSILGVSDEVIARIKEETVL